METTFSNNTNFDRFCGKKAFIDALGRKDIVTMRGSFLFFFHEQSLLAEIGLDRGDIEWLYYFFSGPPTIEEALNYAIKKMCDDKLNSSVAQALSYYGWRLGIRVDFPQSLKWHQDKFFEPHFEIKIRLVV